MTRLPKQRTIAQSATVKGYGFFTNADVTVTFQPAEPDTGILFVRSDLPGRPEVPATIEFAVERHRRTALERGEAKVELTEHLLASLAGLAIDNCIVELDGPEPPGGDGSARHFVDALLTAGIVEQEQPAAIFEVPSQLRIGSREGSGQITTHPPVSGLASRLANRRSGGEVAATRHHLTLRYELDYGDGAAVPKQFAEFVLTPETFAAEIAGMRTFIFESEIESLRARGYGEKVTSADLLVFGASGVIGNALRADNECARHKLLDCIGDFALIGGRLTGRVIASRSGHAENRELIRKLTRARSASRAA